MDAPSGAPAPAAEIVVAALRRVAPDCDIDHLRPDGPLGEQLELDSLDWLNVADAIEQALGHSLAAGTVGPAASLQSIVTAMAPAAPATAAGPGDELANSRMQDTGIHLRPLSAADAALEAEFVRSLSDESRYLRFMTTLRELPPAKLRELTEVDQQHHLAIAAIASAGEQERIVGVARCIVEPDEHSGEFAITVADPWQHRGLAGALMHALITAARARRLDRIHGLVLATNRPMLRLARQLGFAVVAGEDARLRHVELRLA